jgi:hypothetical protein
LLLLDLPRIIYHYFYSHCNRYVMISYCGLTCISLGANMWNLLVCLIVIW